jgi:hypothetical protein
MLGLLMLGCGWFDTRSPAEPSESNVPWRQPTQAHYVVENLENTLEGMDLTLYGRCIDADRFLFQADPVLAQIDPSRYENWRWAVEEGSTRRMLEAVEQHWGTADSAIVLAFTEEEWLVNEADTSMVQYRYHLTVHHGRTDVDSLAVGTLRWGFRRSAADRLWYLAGWSDFADEAGTAWSTIRGAFRQ